MTIYPYPCTLSYLTGYFIVFMTHGNCYDFFLLNERLRYYAYSFFYYRNFPLSTAFAKIFVCLGMRNIEENAECRDSTLSRGERDT